MGLFDKLFKKDDKYVELQNIVLKTNEKRLVISNQKLTEAVDIYISNHARIINDCSKILNTTKNPDIFLERYSLLLEHSKELEKIEKFGVLKEPLPSQQRQVIEQKYPFTVCSLVKRIWNDTLQKCERLKTESSKNRNVEKTLLLLQSHELDFPKEYKELVDNLAETVIDWENISEFYK